MVLGQEDESVSMATGVMEKALYSSYTLINKTFRSIYRSRFRQGLTFATRKLNFWQKLAMMRSRGIQATGSYTLQLDCKVLMHRLIGPNTNVQLLNAMQ